MLIRTMQNEATARTDRNDEDEENNTEGVQEDKSSAHEEEQRDESSVEEEKQDDKSSAEKQERDGQSSARDSTAPTPLEGVEIGLHALDRILPDGLKGMSNPFNDGMDGLNSGSHGGSDAGPGDSDDNEVQVLSPSNGVAKRRLSLVIEDGSTEAVVSSSTPSRAKKPKRSVTPQTAGLMSRPTRPEHTIQYPPLMTPAYVAEKDHQAMQHSTYNDCAQQ